MALASTTAFVLKVDPISERDVAASFLTKDHGVVRGAVRGARGRSKKAAALQTLNEVSATYFRKEGAELARVDALEVVHGSYALAARAETAMALPYLAESALTFVPENEPGGDVYRLVGHVRDALEAGAEAGLALRYFEVWLLRFAGLLPDFASCAVCGGALAAEAVDLDPELPGFVHRACSGRAAVPIGAAALALLPAFRRLSLPALSQAGAASERAALDELEGLAREVRRRFLGHELKSYRFLRSLGGSTW